MLAEVKAEAVYLITRVVLENYVPPVSLHLVEGATLGKAKESEKNGADFKSLADSYYTVFIKEEDLTVKSESLFNLIQQLINLGSFKQARNFLVKAGNILIDREGIQRSMILARRQEKLGWIEDYQLGFTRSRDAFIKAAEYLQMAASPQQWTDEQRDLYSTTRHFLGRAHYGLASFGVERFENLAQAGLYFREALELDSLKDVYNMNAKVGFGHAWLARCYMMTRSRMQADYEINLTEEAFERQLKITPGNKGLKAHFDLLKGERFLIDGDYVSAASYFADAVRLRTLPPPDGEFYPKGLADAYLGLARSYWGMGIPGEAGRYFRLAIKAHPYAVLRGAVTGA